MLIRAREWWEGLGRKSQLTIGLASLGVLIALIGFVAWANTPEYGLLFTKLSAPDAAAITDKLKESGVPYRTSQNSSAIEIPQQLVDETRMKLIALGLPQQDTASTGGDDILKTASMTDTSNMEQLRMQRSLEDRVSKSITSMDPVASATIHYAPSEKSPFATANKEATAAVFVTLKPGRTLSDENVRAIVRCTQMSFTGLTSDKSITVADSQGDLLWDGTRAGTMDGGDVDKRARTKEIAMRLDLTRALETAIGPRTCIVLPHVELKQGEEKRHEQTSQPGTPVQKSSSKEEYLAGRGAGGQLPIGAAGNITGPPTYQAAAAGNGGKFTKQTDSVTNSPTVLISDILIPAGGIKKLTVSVLLDSAKIPAADLAATIEKVKQIVETNVAADPSDLTLSRMVSVAAVAFDHSEEAASARAAAEAASAERTQRMAVFGVPLLIMAIMLFMLARASRKSFQLSPAGRQLALAGGINSLNGMPLMFDGEGNPLPGQMIGTDMVLGSDGPLGLAGSNAPRTFEVIQEAFDANLESILHLTRAKPEMVAALVKGWISEE